MKSAALLICDENHVDFTTTRLIIPLMAAIELHPLESAETKIPVDLRHAAVVEIVAERLGVLNLPGIIAIEFYEIGEYEIASIEAALTRYGYLGPDERLEEVYPGLLNEVTPQKNPGQPVIHVKIAHSAMAEVIELRAITDQPPAA